MPSFVNMPIPTLISENLYDVVFFHARHYLPTGRTHDAFITILNGYSDCFSAAIALIFYRPTEFQPATSNNLDPPCPGAVGVPVRWMSFKHYCLMSLRGQERRI